MLALYRMWVGLVGPSETTARMSQTISIGDRLTWPAASAGRPKLLPGVLLTDRILHGGNIRFYVQIPNIYPLFRPFPYIWRVFSGFLRFLEEVGKRVGYLEIPRHQVDHPVDALIDRNQHQRRL